MIVYHYRGLRCLNSVEFFPVSMGESARRILEGEGSGVMKHYNHESISGSSNCGSSEHERCKVCAIIYRYRAIPKESLELDEQRVSFNGTLSSL